MSNKSVTPLWNGNWGRRKSPAFAGSDIIVAFYRIAVIVTGLIMAASCAAKARASGADSTNLPDRYLHCVVARSTNIDPTRMQSASEIKSEGRHDFLLRLAPIAPRVGAPPDPIDPPDPVDARTKILLDPDGLTNGVSQQFERVVDYWPKRVELMSTIPNSIWAHIIIIDPIDAAKGRARLFMAHVKDAGTFDLARIYQGSCRVDANPRPLARR